MRSSFLPKWKRKITRISALPYKQGSFFWWFFGECRQFFFGYDPCLFGRAEILVILGLNFGRNDDLMNSFWIWLTFTYLPRLVNVVKERPPKESKDFAWTELRTEVVRMLGLFVPILPQSVRCPSQGILHVVCLLFLIEQKKISCAWFALHDYFYPIVKLLKNNQ